MRELYVRNLVGEEFPLSKYTVKRNKSVENAARTISVEILLDVQENLQGYREIRNQTYLIFEGETYVAGNVKEVTSGQTKKTLTAEHIFYQRMKLRNRIYTTITGSRTPKELLDFVLKDTGYTLVLDTTNLPEKIDVENFGNNNPLALLQELVTTKMQAEFDYSDTQVFVSSEIGRVTDKQFRHEYNIDSPSKEIDTTNLRTYIKGFSTQNADGSYYYVADYTSPLAEVYGILIADPLYDDQYKSSASLKEACKQTLTDTIDFTIQLTATQLEEMDLRDVQKGDYLWCIIDPFDIDIRVRVVDIEDYEDENKAPLFTLGKVKRKASALIADFREATKAVNNIYDSTTKKLKPTAIDGSKISVSLANATGQVTPSQLPFSTASTSQAGLMSAADYTKLNNLKTGADGYVTVPLATALNAGLLSAELFKKLNLLQVDQNGLVIVDLSTNQTIKNIQDRLTALENSSSS